MSDIPEAWVVRGSGADWRHGEGYATFVRDFVKENKVAVIGWTDKFSDLTQVEDEVQLRKLFQSVYGTSHQKGPDSGLKILERFRFKIRLRDLIVMPWKSKEKKPADIFSLGVVAREYYWESSVSGGLDKEMHHRIGVKWIEEDFPREIFDGEFVNGKSLYKRLSKPPTVYLIGGKENNQRCSQRLQEIMDSVTDPGSNEDSIRSQSQGGVPYRETIPQEIVEMREVWEVDPDLKDRGTEAHKNIQNELAEAVRSAGLEPRSPASDDPQFDVAWRQGASAYVIEVKSMTAENEERQLRLGLGQVLRYASLLKWSGVETVQPILAVERSPTDASWEALCEEHGVILTWPDQFRELFD